MSRCFCRSFILTVSLLKMKLLLKLILVVVGIVLVVNSLTLNQAARDYSFTVSPSAGVPPSSEILFKQKCTKCHGTDGSGDTSMGRIFNAPDFTDGNWWAKHNPGELVNAITRGRKNMPAFGKKLTKAQISSLASYVQRFKQ
jgi:mono/diheme cytochrome c family protein